MAHMSWTVNHIFRRGIEYLVAFWYSYRILIIFFAITLIIISQALKYERADKIQRQHRRSSSPHSSEDKKELGDEKSTGGARLPRKIVGGVKKHKSLPVAQTVVSQNIQILVFFSSIAGSTEKAAKNFTRDIAQDLKSFGSSGDITFQEPELLDLSEIDHDDYFISPPKSTSETHYLYLLLLPTYNIDTSLDAFIEHLKETHNDFRIDTYPLSSLLGYSVFGFGDREGWPTEEEGFCSQAREVDKWMAKLTRRKRVFPLGMGDTKKDAIERLDEWKKGVKDVLNSIFTTGSLTEAIIGTDDSLEIDSDDMEDENENEDQNSSDEQKIRPKKSTPLVKSALNDLEDIGTNLNQASASREMDFTTTSDQKIATIKKMVPQNSPTYTALTKQGYSIVGSHSGVKICRWTKSALRGRGSCYKYSFYGIASHQCMETTPSLSCSNKCVFCWRHGTNPVGTTWRWVVDPPDVIFNGVKAKHYQKIKMMRGVPGVRAERFAEAMQIQHCALSLVGEPIFYPHINAFTALLHAEHISSFLVCNAQHPDQLATLRPVTQLYVSIDASNRESLRRIDRPLHRDFWERFNRCLDILRQRRFEQRTVFRLTLVKGFNIEDEVMGYADLVEKSLPCFVEIKGVTYCGTSASSTASLTMQNVPFYEEVCAFAEALNAELKARDLGYGIAAEHAHSCCILIASERFLVQGKWHTRIDYQKFFQCLESGKKFTPEDYMGPETPDWALWGNGGFDPRDERVYRKGKKKVPMQDKSSELGSR